MGGRILCSYRFCETRTYSVPTVRCSEGGTEITLKESFNKCNKARGHIDTLWKKYKRHRSQAAFDKHIRARYDCIRIRRKDKRGMKETGGKSKGHPKLSHMITRANQHKKDQIIRLKILKGKAFDTDENTLEDPEIPPLPAMGREDTLKKY